MESRQEDNIRVFECFYFDVFPGAPSIGNCGLGHSLALTPERCRQVLGDLGHYLVFHRDIVLSFTGAGSAMGVHSSIPAVSARASIGPLIVVFVPSVRAQDTLPRVMPLVETSTLLTLLPGSPIPQLPTPVNLNNCPISCCRGYRRFPSTLRGFLLFLSGS